MAGCNDGSVYVFSEPHQEAPPRVDSCAVLGWLPAAAPGADGEAGEAGLNDFRENGASVRSRAANPRRGRGAGDSRESRALTRGQTGSGA